VRNVIDLLEIKKCASSWYKTLLANLKITSHLLFGAVPLIEYRDPELWAKYKEFETV
jgi:hypothetical protein